MRCGARRRAGRTVLALLAGLLAGAWAGGGLVWVFNRTKIREGAGEVAAVSLATADELELVPADAAGFAHVRATDLWKTEGMAEYRRVMGKAGEDMLKALDDGFVPAPSTLDRVTVVALARPAPPPPAPGVIPGLQPKGKGGFVQPPVLIPADARPDLDVVGLLTFTTPFDAAKVREANLPKGVKTVVGEGEMWSDPGAGVALAAKGDRTLVVGPPPAVRAFLLKAKTPDGPLAPALRLAAGGSRHVIGALNLKAYPLPPDLTKSIPPEATAVLRADALAVGAVVGRGVKLDLRAAYRDDAAAEEAEKALRKSAEAGRKSLGEAKAKMQDAVAGKAGGPKPRPVAELPEAVAGLFALGAIGMLDEWLANPPLERAGPELSAAVSMDSVGGAYATTAAMSIGLMLPAVQKVREAAARAQDQNNLRQIGFALHAHHDVYNRFPAAGLTSPPNRPNGKALLSWRVAILPYLDENALYNQFKLDEPWDGPNNKKLLAQMPKVYARPGGTSEPGKTHYKVFATPETAFPHSMFGRTQGRRMAEVQDGTSNTIMVVEATDPVEWTKPDDLEFSATAPFPRLGLPGAAGFNALMGDGTVRFIPHTTRPATIRIMVGADDGVPNPPE